MRSTPLYFDAVKFNNFSDIIIKIDDLFDLFY